MTKDISLSINNNRKIQIFIKWIPYAIFMLASVIAVPNTPALAAQYVKPGDSISGDLTSEDLQRAGGFLYDEYSISCKAGDLLDITMISEEIDSYLIIIGPSGTQWENDDYQSGNRNAFLHIYATGPGEYKIMCSSRKANETGKYQLAIESKKVPRLFGVFVGIADYGTRDLKAPYCDLDAQKLYNDLIDLKLTTSANSVLLTNQQATLVNLKGAFASLRHLMGPDDVFFFFFSGHGDQLPASGKKLINELDNRDEILCLADANIADDKFAEMLGTIKTGLIVTAIDTCNSGGFANDIVDRPGRVFYGSTDEDFFSDFAPERKAGGFLSIMFREAITLGAGDLNNDGIITIGELTRFLQMEYYVEVPNPTSGVCGYPELVHDRGTVPQETIFLAIGVHPVEKTRF
jgi:hypothetical protein